MNINCGRCIGCRKMKQREWQIRMYHEAQHCLELDQGTSFLTLTYSDEHIPMGQLDEFGDVSPPANNRRPRPSLRYDHLVGFTTRLRRALDYHFKRQITFYIAGEYGGQTGRPHYHAAIFGWSFPDRQPLSVRGKSGKTLYSSPLLSRAWPYGYSSIGTETGASAFSYVAKYITKGLSRDQELSLGYGDQEFSAAYKSRGLGFRWLERHWPDLYPSDQVIMDGKAYPIPRAYDKKLEEWEPEVFGIVSRARKHRSKEYYREMMIECEQNPFRMEQKREHAEEINASFTDSL